MECFPPPPPSAGSLPPLAISVRDFPAYIFSMNLSRVIGPVLAGTLLAVVNEALVFVLNALLAGIAFMLILPWRSQPRTSALPGERFVGAMRVGFNFAR